MIKIAYVILAHNNPKQLNIFINQMLSYGDCDIYIHIDKKNKQMINKIQTNKHVFVFCEYEIAWGSIEIMKATIFLMKQVLKANIEYTHIYYGSGNDLLVKKGLYEYLAKNSDKVFMKIQGELTPKNRLSDRYLVRWSHKLMVRSDYHPYRFVRIVIHALYKAGINIWPNLKTIEFKHIYRGSQWFIAPYNIISYLIKYIENHPNYVQYWEDSLAPDEFLLHTIIMNSEYADLVEEQLMYINFSNNRVRQNHPTTITMNDIQKIEESSAFCARKFDIKKDNEVINYYIEKTRK